MSEVFKIACANFREHPARIILTSLAASASPCLVIWIAGGYEALLKTFDEYADVAFGRYSLAVAPIAMADLGAVPPGVATAVLVGRARPLKLLQEGRGTF